MLKFLLTVIYSKEKVMSKAKAKASKEVAVKEGESSSGVSWIPSAPSGTESKKQDLSLSTILELKFISTELDRLGRYSTYFVCLNPEALNILKEYIDTQGLDIKHLITFLGWRFW